MKNILLFMAAMMLLTTTAISNPVNDTVVMGPSYANDVFYSLANGLVKVEPRNNWDIAFYTNRWSAGITINDGTGVMLYTYPNGDTTAWSTLDTTGMTSWKNNYNSDTIWEDGAFNRNALGHPDYGWGKYNMVSHDVIGDSLYIVKLASGALKKVWVQRKNSVLNTFYFKYANIDGTDEKVEVLNVTPYEDKMFVYYSLTNQIVVDREPAIASWDILFSKYAAIVYDSNGDPSYYLVVGALSNLEVAASKNMPVAPTFEDWFLTDFKDHKTPIGHDWKSFNMAQFQWIVEDSLTYFVKSKEGNIYKLIFDYFSGSMSGKAGFTKKLVSLVSVDENLSPTNEMILFPNPAINTIHIQFTSFENESVEIRVFDQRGRLVINQKENLMSGKYSMDVNQLENGLYIIEASSNGQINRQKIIIQH